MKKSTFFIGLIVIGILALIGSCDSSSGSSYSDEYNNNKEYRDNVNEAADAFGEDPGHVDDVYNALADEMY
ncbi:MAG: hypothetical protein PUB99_02590 [Oscillospiraceae bacterium]|nr:hypothetical protein [Oscillospiraceae bacterium]